MKHNRLKLVKVFQLVNIVIWFLFGVLFCFGYSVFGDRITNPNDFLRLGAFLVALFVDIMIMLMVYLDYYTNDHANKLFFWLLIVTAVDLVICIASIFHNFSNQFFFIGILIVFLVSPVSCFLFWIYQNYIGNQGHFSLNGTDKLLFFLGVADCIFLVLGGVFGFVFSVGATGEYFVGDAYFLTYVYPFFVLIYCIVKNFFYRISFRKHMALLAFALCPMIMGILSLVLHNTIFSHLANVIGVFIIYGGIQTERGREFLEQSRALQQTRINVALLQIKPHFIQNCLTNIRGLMHLDVAAAEEMLNNLAGYLRDTFTFLDDDMMISVRQEMELVDFYVAIEQARFPDSFTIEKDIDLWDYEIPSLIIEPLVENAIRHGIREKETKGHIKIYVKEREDHIELGVTDDGVGFEVADVFSDTSGHIGLKTTKSRIELMTRGNFQIESHPGLGTRVTICIPRKGKK